MNRFEVTVTGETTDHLTKAIELCEMKIRCGVSHYSVDPTLGLMLYWNDDKEEKPKQIELPCYMTGKLLVAIVANWLEHREDREFGATPDCDGDVKRGFTLTTNTGHRHVNFAVKPTWIVYGK